jgi:flagellar FliJ protein
MPRFVFKLEGLLRNRRRVERQRQRDLAILQRQARRLEEELRELGAAMTRANQQARNSLVGRLDLAFLAAHRRYLAVMQRNGQALIQKIASLGPQIEASRQALTAAAKDRKVIEKLRERRRELWLADEAKREQADLDEAANQMFYAELARKSE